MNDSGIDAICNATFMDRPFTSMPVVLVASVVGVIVSLVQALTQIQDQTLKFMIKLLAIAITHGQLPMA
ncbi:flagellar biosynthetic protein FliQ [Salmonella enterica subsp. enterica]|nr:flagellar biosynthetic protein FliQ [Salmonella enterica subsp. enterica]